MHACKKQNKTKPNLNILQTNGSVAGNVDPRLLQLTRVPSTVHLPSTCVGSSVTADADGPACPVGCPGDLLLPPRVLRVC